MAIILKDKKGVVKGSDSINEIYISGPWTGFGNAVGKVHDESKVEQFFINLNLLGYWKESQLFRTRNRKTKRGSFRRGETKN